MTDDRAWFEKKAVFFSRSKTSVFPFWKNNDEIKWRQMPITHLMEMEKCRTMKKSTRFEFFTEKLASILKGWSSLNNNKKMKWFSTYTGLFFSFLMEEFEEEVGGYIDFQFFFSVFFTRTVSGFFQHRSFGDSRFVSFCDFYIRMNSRLF